MKLHFFGHSLLYSALAAAVLFFSHYNYIWIALVAILVPAVLTWRREGANWDALLKAVPELIFGLSVVALIGLTRQSGGQLIFPPITQIVLSVVYGGFVLWRHYTGSTTNALLAVTALSQFSAVTAIFLAATYWQWSSFLVVVAVWIASYLVGKWYFAEIDESAGTILAATWALVAAQMSWVFYLWLVNYVLGGYFIIPQAALVLLGVGYCFMSIYAAHVQKSLSRRRLIEYLVIGGVMLAVVVAGTRWDGTL